MDRAATATARIAASVGKVEALDLWLSQAGQPTGPSGSKAVAAAVARVTAALGRRGNARVELSPCGSLAELDVRLVAGKGMRRLAPPRHLSGMPSCFTEQSPEAHSPDFRIVSVPAGYYCHYCDGPLVVTGDGNTVVSDLSSPYAGLVHHYDADLRPILADAVQVNGTVIAIADDVRPLNFCHWLVDWLPRLAALGERARRADTYVAVPEIKAAYTWDTLRLCGFDAGRVIQLKDWQAVRARHLLIPDDLADPPHPGHKAAPWLLNYLRATLGYGAILSGQYGPQRRGKLYLSRGTAAGRRVVNEDVLREALALRGYRTLDTDGMAITHQIAQFAGASHIVAPHGAGLANIVFSRSDTTLIEMFPASYGTAAYYVLSAGLGMTYASYVSSRIVAGKRTQLDDFEVDVDDFLTRCGPLL